MRILDPDVVDRLKFSSPREAYDQVREAILRSGGSSDDYMSAIEELVDLGILTWEQIEEFEEGRKQVG